MSYKTFVSMNIAVVGAGADTGNFAANYALAGHEVFMAGKTMTAMERAATRLCENITVCSVEEAAAAADVIVIATPPSEVREIAYWLGDVRGKVIIDATANIRSEMGEQINTLGAIKAITGSPYIVKIFCTSGYQQLLKPLLKKDAVSWVLVSDSIKAKEATKILARDMAVHNFVDLGGSEAIQLFDVMTRSWRELTQKNPNKEKASTK